MLRDGVGVFALMYMKNKILVGNRDEKLCRCSLTVQMRKHGCLKNEPFLSRWCPRVHRTGCSMLLHHRYATGLFD